MKQSLRMEPKINAIGLRTKVTFETDPYSIATGALRNMQKYCAILLTTKGTDKLRPNFGTNLVDLQGMNIQTTSETRLFITDQINSANSQFFAIQNADRTLLEDDIMLNVTLIDISISSTNKIIISLLFTPKTTKAITMSLNV